MNLKNFIANLFLPVLVLFVLSCGNKQHEKLITEKIKFDPNDTTTVFMEDFTEKYYFKPLASDSTFMVKRADRLFVTDSLIMIGDLSQDAVFVFNMDGSMRKKIFNKGPKKDQYSTMTDVNYDESAKELIVLDSHISKVFHYQLDGKCTKVDDLSPIDKAGLAIFAGKDALFFDRLNVARDLNHVGVYDKESAKFITSYIPSPNITSRLAMRSSHNFEAYQGNTYYVNCLDPFIYQLNSDSFDKAYQFDIPLKNVIPARVAAIRIKGFMDFDNAMKREQCIYRVDDLFMNDKYVHFSLMYRGMPQNVFYSKKSKRAMHILAYKTKKNPDKYFMSRVSAQHDGFYISLVPPQQYEDVGVKASDNPVLMFYKLKDF